MITDFPNIQRGTRWQDVSARQWRNLIDVVRRVANMTVGPGLTIRNHGTTLNVGLLSKPVVAPCVEGAVGIEVRAFLYESQLPDELIVVPFDDDEHAYPDPLRIAKPYMLRRTPFDGKRRNAILYNYSTHVRRQTKKLGTPDAFEIVVPSWHFKRPGESIEHSDTIVAAHVGMSVTRIEREEGDDPTVWLDLNVDSRAWAMELG